MQYLTYSWRFARLCCRAVALLLIALAWTSAATAQTATMRAYSLQEVMQRASQRAPELLLALSTLARVQAEQSIAQGRYLPTLTARGSVGAIYDNRLVIPKQPRIDSKGLDARGTVGVEWVLLDGSRRQLVRAARETTAAERESSELTRQRVLAAAVELYLRALTAEELVRDASITLERRISQHEAIAGLARAGVRPPVDEQRARIEVLNARANMRRRQLERDAGRAALAAAMGDDPLLHAAAAPLASTTLPIPGDLPEAVRLAEQHRRETRELSQRLRAREAELAAALRARLPTVGVSGSGNVSYFHLLAGQGIEGAQYDASGALYLNWSLLDATVWRQGKRAAAARDEARRALERSKFEVRREVVEAHYTLRTAQTQVEQAVAVSSVATVTREALNERYRAGVASLLELLDAEDVEQRARQGRIEAELAYLTAQADLLRVCGLVDRLADEG